MKKRNHIVLLSSFSLWFMMIFPSFGFAQDMPDVYGKFAAAMPEYGQTLLYDKNADERAYPASLTKLLTAILLFENIKDDEWITASDFAANQEASNSQFRIKSGERISKTDALNVMLILSANDIAEAVAEHISGSREKFAELMNEKAKALGANNSHFVTPNGLHDPNHYTTAHDMLLIAKDALSYPEIARAMGMTSYQFTTSERTVSITGSAQKLKVPNSIGGKTGYTLTAKNNLLIVTQIDQARLITVVMKSSKSREYKDIENINQYVSANLESHTILRAGQMISAGGQSFRVQSNVNAFIAPTEQMNWHYEKSAARTDTLNITANGQWIGTVQAQLQLPAQPVSVKSAITQTKDVISKQETDSPPVWQECVSSLAFFLCIFLIRVAVVLRSNKLKK